MFWKEELADENGEDNENTGECHQRQARLFLVRSAADDAHGLRQVHHIKVMNLEKETRG